MLRRAFLGALAALPFIGGWRSNSAVAHSALKLVPVGLEVDGSIKPIKELSYRTVQIVIEGTISADSEEALKDRIIEIEAAVSGDAIVTVSCGDRCLVNAKKANVRQLRWLYHSDRYSVNYRIIIGD